jgi:hypothetical protein
VRIESQLACKCFGLCALFFVLGALYLVRITLVRSDPRILLFSHEVQSLDYEMLIPKSKAQSTKSKALPPHFP